MLKVTGRSAAERGRTGGVTGCVLPSTCAAAATEGLAGRREFVLLLIAASEPGLGDGCRYVSASAVRGPSSGLRQVLRDVTSTHGCARRKRSHLGSLSQKGTEYGCSRRTGSEWDRRLPSPSPPSIRGAPVVSRGPGVWRSMALKGKIKRQHRESLRQTQTKRLRRAHQEESGRGTPPSGEGKRWGPRASRSPPHEEDTCPLHNDGPAHPNTGEHLPLCENEGGFCLKGLHGARRLIPSATFCSVALLHGLGGGGPESCGESPGTVGGQRGGPRRINPSSWPHL